MKRADSTDRQRKTSHIASYFVPSASFTQVVENELDVAGQHLANILN